MKRIFTITLIVVCNLISTINLAQSSDTLLIEPGSEYLKSVTYVPYSNKWKVSFQNLEGKKSPNRIWTDYTQIIDLEEKTILVRIQDLYSPSMKLQNTWINRVEIPSLKPIQFSTGTPEGGFSFYQFDADKVNSITNSNNENIVKSDTTYVDRILFDWNLYGILLVALPFEVNAYYKLPYFDTNTLTSKYLSVHIIGKETITNLSSEKIETWKVKTSDNLEFWLIKEAPYVIKLELSIPDRGKLIWDSY